MQWVYLTELSANTQVRGVRDMGSTRIFKAQGVVKKVNQDGCWIQWPWGDLEWFDKTHLFLL